MESLIIQRLSRRYHLRPNERDLADDLDHATERAFGESLDDALARQDLDGEEVICLRQLRVRLDYDSDSSAGRTGDTWSDLIADAIRRALAEHGGHHSDYLVRYPSCLHGLVDFALEVSAGRVRRAWAWNQMDWSHLPDPPSLHQARQQLIQALHREPALLLPLFIRLAQANRLAPWLATLPDADQQALVHHLLTRSGMPDAWLNEAPPAPAIPPRKDRTQSRSASMAIQESRIARHLSSHARTWLAHNAIPAHQWALICLLEREPAVFSRPTRVIAEHLASAEIQWRQLTGNAVHPNKPAPNAEPSHGNNPDSRLGDQRSQSFDDGNANDRVIHELPSGTIADESMNPDNVSVDPSIGEDTGDQIEPDQTSEAVDSPEDEPFAPWLEPTVRHSDWGGLFYLLPLLEDPPTPGETGIATALIEAPVFGKRSLAWVFFHFFLRLFEQECGYPQQTRSGCPANQETLPPFPEADPSLRILSHLPVDEDIPDFEAPASAEQDALDTQVYRCSLALQRRLPQPEKTPRDQWLWLCQRPARLYLDTAWIDVHFNLDRLDTDIRKAGLDLDPGYVPWLGKVVKLHYD